MKRDVVLVGVGGQGVLSIASIIAAAALREGLRVKQSEIHGMAQRGSGVYAHLRMADTPIWSDLIPRSGADLIVSMEPLEIFRYLGYLGPEGTIVTSVTPVQNIPTYPPIEAVLDALRAIPRVVLVDVERLARRAGSPRAANVVLVGAASHYLPFRLETYRTLLREAFASKGDKIVRANEEGLRLGREAVPCAVA